MFCVIAASSSFEHFEHWYIVNVPGLICTVPSLTSMTFITISETTEELSVAGITWHALAASSSPGLRRLVSGPTLVYLVFNLISAFVTVLEKTKELPVIDITLYSPTESFSSVPWWLVTGFGSVCVVSGVVAEVRWHWGLPGPSVPVLSSEIALCHMNACPLSSDLFFAHDYLCCTNLPANR